MRSVLESDTAVYVAVGIFTIAVFVVGVVAIHLWTPVTLSPRELTMFSLGFFLFMALFFVSMSMARILEP